MEIIIRSLIFALKYIFSKLSKNYPIGTEACDCVDRGIARVASSPTPCALKASFQIFGRGDRTPFRIAPLTESDTMRPYAPPENEKK